MVDLAIDVQAISKSFQGKLAVNNIALQVRRGEIYGFLGPNGSGKTTTIRMLCGLLTPDNGAGQCLGYDILRQAKQIKQRVGYMTQHFSLYNELSIYENLLFSARIYGINKSQEKIAAVIARLGLADRQQQLAGTLSGGWKQRLALAGVLLHEPQLLLLDEPTAGVDPKARREFWEHIHALSAEGITTLVSTHYMDEAERCHRLAYICNGDLLVQGTTNEIIARVGLTTWVVTGMQLNPLAATLRTLPGVEQVVALGNKLHVSGKDAAQLQQSLAPYQRNPDYVWTQVPASLEDVFIYLVKGPDV